ncbi:MAG: MltA domain-containing protein, partial [Thiothrix sp.]
VDDPFNLYLAHVQGSALLRFPDGTQQLIDYDSDNGKKFSSIATYLKQRGYLHGSISNADIQAWLQANPDKQFEVMTSNPRYIYFHESQELPRTASGSSVIPGHTIAVDSNYIPLGSIILAELPRFADNGQINGREWRLLLAQDRGKGVVGRGRIDLYTGIGAAAEQRAYQVSGLRRAYLVVRHPS